VVVFGWVGYYTHGASRVVTCFEFRLACFGGALLAAALLGWFGHCLVGLGTTWLVWALLGWFRHYLVGLGTAWLVWVLLGWLVWVC
jgi:hypothetical protein